MHDEDYIEGRRATRRARRRRGRRAERRGLEVRTRRVGGVDTCVVSDGYVTSIGYCPAQSMEIGRSGKAGKWLKRTFGKKGSAWKSLSGIIKGLTSSISQSPVLPPTYRAAITALGSVVSPSDLEGTATVVRPPSTPDETADQIASLRLALEARGALEDDLEDAEWTR